MKRESSNHQLIMRASFISVVGNILLSLFKLIAGLVAHSEAMVSDAVHSASDVFSTFVVLIGIKMAGKQPDKDHPYGHERMECVAALLLAMLLGAVGIGIGYNGLQTVFTQEASNLEEPGLLALIAAVVSIAVKEGMYWYTRAIAKKVHSGALMADAWHHRSDALSSVGSFAGILGARLGLPILDPIAAMIICVFIIKAAADIFMDAVGKMTDKACDENYEKELRTCILGQEGVMGIDSLRTRLFGDRVYMDVEICAAGELTLYEAHTVAERVHDEIEKSFPDIKHCMVHVNPAQKEEEEEQGEREEERE